MPTRNLDPTNLQLDEDWEGNNAAYTCPHCDKVFLVTDKPGPPHSHVGQGVRHCPQCGKSTGRVSGGRDSGGTASIEW